MSDKETVKDFLLNQRLQNYGYDYKWFRKMSALKTKMKNRLEGTPDAEIRRVLAKEGILGKGKRLGIVRNSKGRKVVDYTTGQSFNEELLNMMVLSGTKGKKSFYEIQDRWME